VNSRSLFVLVMACLLALAAIVVRSGGLLVIAIPFLTYALFGVFLFPERPRLAVARTVNRSSALAGEPVRVTLTVTNHGATMACVRVRDPLPQAARLLDGRAQQTLCLAGNEEAEMAYTFESDRGLCRWHTVEVAAMDPLGLFETRVQVAAPDEVIVRPIPIEISGVPFRPRRTMRSPGQVPIPRAGPGTSFLGVREYRPGDALRHINWRLAARHPGRLYTNEHERQELADFGIILDARQSLDEVFERSVSAVASLAESILRDGNRLSLLVFGRSMAAAFPGYGKRQIDTVMRTLAAATRSTQIAFNFLEYFPARLFSHRAVLLIVSTASPRDLPTYSRLRAAGYEVLLISPDPVEVAGRLVSATSSEMAGIRAARIERRLVLLSLSKLGVHVVDWQIDRPLDAALEAISPQVVHRMRLKV
jgi:uncharacterized protein (DUF58 family)